MSLLSGRGGKNTVSYFFPPGPPRPWVSAPLHLVSSATGLMKPSEGTESRRAYCHLVGPAMGAGCERCPPVYPQSAVARVGCSGPGSEGELDGVQEAPALTVLPSPSLCALPLGAAGPGQRPGKGGGPVPSTGGGGTGWKKPREEVGRHLLVVGHAGRVGGFNLGVSHVRMVQPSTGRTRVVQSRLLN